MCSLDKNVHALSEAHFTYLLITTHQGLSDYIELICNYNIVIPVLLSLNIYMTTVVNTNKHWLSQMDVM